MQKYVNILADVAEVQEWTAAASATGQTLSEWVRSRCNDKRTLLIPCPADDDIARWHDDGGPPVVGEGVALPGQVEFLVARLGAEDCDGDIIDPAGCTIAPGVKEPVVFTHEAAHIFGGRLHQADDPGSKLATGTGFAVEDVQDTDAQAVQDYLAKVRPKEPETPANWPTQVTPWTCRNTKNGRRCMTANTSVNKKCVVCGAKRPK